MVTNLQFPLLKGCALCMKLWHTESDNGFEHLQLEGQNRHSQLTISLATYIRMNPKNKAE